MREGLRKNRQALVCLGVKVRKGDLESGSFLILSPGTSLEGQADMAGHSLAFPEGHGGPCSQRCLYECGVEGRGETADAAVALGHQVWNGSLWEASGCSGLPHCRQLERGLAEGLPQPSFCVCGVEGRFLAAIRRVEVNYL